MARRQATVPVPEDGPQVIQLRARNIAGAGEASDPLRFRTVENRKVRQIRAEDPREGGRWIDVSDFGIANALRQIMARSERTERGTIAASADIVKLRTEVSQSIAFAIQTLQTRVEENGGSIEANAELISGLETAVGERALSSAVEALTSRVSVTEDTNQSQADALTTLNSMVDSINTDLGTKAAATAVDALETRVLATETGLAAESRQVTELVAQVMDRATVRALQQLEVKVDSNEGNLARWLVKTQVNDLVGGIGLYNDGSKVRLMISADAFAILPTGSQSDANARIPFAVTDGQVYLDDAVIRNASISGAKIRNATITNAHIVDATIQFGKIVKGDIFDLTINNVIQSSNYRAGVSGWRLAKDGEAQMPAAHILGRLRADQVQIDINEFDTDVNGNLILNRIGASKITGRLDANLIPIGTQFRVTPGGLLTIAGLNAGIINQGTLDARRLARTGQFGVDATGRLRLDSISANLIQTGTLNAGRLALSGNEISVSSTGRLQLRRVAEAVASAANTGVYDFFGIYPVGRTPPATPANHSRVGNRQINNFVVGRSTISSTVLGYSFAVGVAAFTYSQTYVDRNGNFISRSYT